MCWYAIKSKTTKENSLLTYILFTVQWEWMTCWNNFLCTRNLLHSVWFKLVKQENFTVLWTLPNSSSKNTSFWGISLNGLSLLRTLDYLGHLQSLSRSHISSCIYTRRQRGMHWLIHGIREWIYITLHRGTDISKAFLYSSVKPKQKNHMYIDIYKS